MRHLLSSFGAHSSEHFQDEFKRSITSQGKAFKMRPPTKFGRMAMKRAQHAAQQSPQ